MMTGITQKVDETFDQLDNLDTLCELFFVERKFTIYKNISSVLRLLLPGSSGQLGIIQDVLPAGTLSPLCNIPEPSAKPGHLLLPGKVVIENGKSKITMGFVYLKQLNVNGGAVGKTRIEAVFDDAAPAIPFIAWLAQPFLRHDWTLKKFINTVADKDGGAHHDPNDVLHSLQDLGYIHWLLIAEIGRSISPQLRRQIHASYPAHVRPVR